MTRDQNIREGLFLKSQKRECQGRPHAGTTVDLHVALKPHRENVLIDALYKASDPRHSMYVFIPITLLSSYFAHNLHPYRFKYAMYLQKGHVAELTVMLPDSLDLAGLHAMRFHLLRFRSPWRDLVDNLQCGSDESKYASFCRLSILPSRGDGGNCNSRDWLCAALCSALVRPDCRTYNVLWRAMGSPSVHPK